MSAISTATALLVTAGVTAVTAGATLGYEASQGGGPAAPTVQSNAQQEAAAANASAMAQAEALTKRRGMASTMLTSPLGTQTGANVAKPTLG